MIDLPQADFITLGKAIAELENTEPLLSIARLNIHALPEDPQFQQVSLSVATIIENDEDFFAPPLLHPGATRSGRRRRQFRGSGENSVVFHFRGQQPQSILADRLETRDQDKGPEHP